MKISMEVGVIAFMRCHKMINGSKLLIFSSRSWDFGIEDFFRTRCGECGECGRPAGRPAGWPASRRSRLLQQFFLKVFERVLGSKVAPARTARSARTPAPFFMTRPFKNCQKKLWRGFFDSFRSFRESPMSSPHSIVLFCDPFLLIFILNSD